MPPHLKKLIGTLGILVWVLFYSLIAMRLAVTVLPGANGFVQLFFYAIAGTVWIIPVGLALPWMHRDPKARDRLKNP